MDIYRVRSMVTEVLWSTLRKALLTTEGWRMGKYRKTVQREIFGAEY